MRIEAPDGSWWIELRDVDALTGGDEDAWNRPIREAVGTFDVDLGDDEPELSADGVTMKAPEKRKVKVPMSVLDARRDTLLGRLITGWSFPQELPYRGAYRSELPLAACKQLDRATEPHKKALSDDGPDPKEATTATSSTGTAGG